VGTRIRVANELDSVLFELSAFDCYVGKGARGHVPLFSLTSPFCPFRICCFRPVGGHLVHYNSVADLGFLDGMTLGTRRKLRGPGLTEEFYAFVN